ncbi:MAG: HAMP domain-containing histidine kinase [Clostridia bacterium]|nr:HAMP domain-containing histidine kinase [Clostridia bacterium]
MRSNFLRLFLPTALLLLAAFLFLGVFSQLFLYNHFVSTNEETLYSSASASAELVSAYASIGSPEQNLDLYMDLSYSSRLTDTQTLIINSRGTVILCSEDLQLCEHCGCTIDEAFFTQAVKQGRSVSTDMVTEIYGQTRLAVAVPIKSVDGKAIGLAVSSLPMAQIHTMLRKATTVFILTAACVLTLVLIIMLFVANRQSKPLRSLASAARDLGHGQLDTRVPTDKPYSKEFAELAVAFNNMAASLQSAEAQRQEFIANVSHELKTPMTTISGYLDGMLDGTIPKEQHSKYMGIVSDEVRRLSRLVRSMLEISRMQSQGIREDQRAHFDIGETVGRVLLSFEQRINEKRLCVEAALPDNPLFVYAEPDSITRVVYNLIDNAVKFCDEGGSLGVTVQTRKNKVSVSVKNTGQSIPASELPLVFERFHKTDKSRSADRDGVGLGLYIAKTIICSHGEDIFVSSRDGETEFSFTLPVSSKTMPERGQTNEST